MAGDYISREKALGIRVTLMLRERMSKPVKESVHKSVEDAFHEFYDHIKELPASDVEEVVHCKDCIDWNGHTCTTIWGMASPKPNDYCSRGERRANNGSKTD